MSDLELENRTQLHIMIRQRKHFIVKPTPTSEVFIIPYVQTTIHTMKKLNSANVGLKYILYNQID